MALVLFHNKNGNVVENKPLIRNVLKAYNKEHATEFYMHPKFGYIEGSVDSPDISRFEYKNRLFSAKYFSGCFYPYLVEVTIK